MADGKYERLVELRSRLPHVSDTVISYFLSKYENVEECYEKLRSGSEELADNSKEFDPRLLNPSHFNAPMKSSGQDTRQPPWDSPTHNQNWNSFRPPEGDPRHGGAPDGGAMQTNFPPGIPHYSGHQQNSSASPNNTRNLDYELICDQKDQLAFLDQERLRCEQATDNLRQEVDRKRHQLTELRISVSDCPTKMDVTSIQDVIVTLEHDVRSLRNKLEVKQQQSVMKRNQDMYTEEGVRWECKRCKFLNHPLMSRCEDCDQTR